MDISLNEKLFFNINRNKSTFKRDNLSLKKVVFVGLLDSNFLEDAFLLKLLTEIDDQTNTYSIQIKFKSIVYYQQFQLEIEENILNEIQGKFIGKIFTFSTLLELV